MKNLQIARKALKFLQWQTPQLRQRLDQAIMELRENPFPYGSKKLIGYPNGFRVRVGDYRIIYHVDAQTLHVDKIAHRKDVYR